MDGGASAKEVDVIQHAKMASKIRLLMGRSVCRVEGIVTHVSSQNCNGVSVSTSVGKQRRSPAMAVSVLPGPCRLSQPERASVRFVCGNRWAIAHRLMAQSAKRIESTVPHIQQTRTSTRRGDTTIAGGGSHRLPSPQPTQAGRVVLDTALCQISTRRTSPKTKFGESDILG